MSDLVERLRALSGNRQQCEHGWSAEGTTWDWLARAADKIEYLESKLKSTALDRDLHRAEHERMRAREKLWQELWQLVLHAEGADSGLWWKIAADGSSEEDRADELRRELGIE